LGFRFNIAARVFGAEQTPGPVARNVSLHILGTALTTSLTSQQIAILRRVSDGLGLPAYVLRPRNCAQDVELLLFFRLIGAGSRGHFIEPAGSDYLAQLDSIDPAEQEPRLVGLSLSRDPSITVECWPQEF
jgi:hypothetical protein